jgi:hypothetical protein
MQRSLLVVLTSVVLSVAVSLLALVAYEGATEQAEASAPPLSRSTESQIPVTAEQLQALQVSLDELSLEVSRLRELRSSDRRSLPMAAASEGSKGEEAQAIAMGALQSGSAAFKAQVAEALTEIEEEREAVEFEEELDERREEAVKANEEYDQLDTDLVTKTQELTDKLLLGSSQSKDMRRLLATQNERNREMTRLWSEGNTSEDELGEIFMSNRAAHRAEIQNLLHSDQLETYRSYLRDGGLGGRFSFFVAPWDEWVQDQEK